MTEQELRALVREALSRYVSGPATSAPHRHAEGPSHRPPVQIAPSHSSHGLLRVPSGDGPCIIEPAVSCNHCGYCKSYGH